MTKLVMSENDKVTDEGWKVSAAGLAVRVCACVFVLGMSTPLFLCALSPSSVAHISFL